jgi:hypothetical protein
LWLEYSLSGTMYSGSSASTWSKLGPVGMRFDVRL